MYHSLDMVVFYLGFIVKANYGKKMFFCPITENFLPELEQYFAIKF